MGSEQAALATLESRDYHEDSPFEATLQRMGDPISRRDWLAAVAAAGVGAVVAPQSSVAPAPVGRPEPRPILPITSTSDVFSPSHGRAFMRSSVAVALGLERRLGEGTAAAQE